MSPLFVVSAVPTPLASGHFIGPYRINACLGSDLDGFDYRAEEHHSGRAVVLREGCPVGLVQRVGAEVVPLAGAETDFRDWLARWSRLLGHWQQSGRASDPARLGYSTLVHIEDRGEAHGTVWVALGPPGGRTLRQVAEDGPGWPDRATVDAGLHACCSAVEALHRLGEFHGSLTPERVQVQDGGAWCLLLPDTDPSRQPLSPWLALEQTEAGQAAGLVTGPWTDVYGIAALAHWLLTGSAPPGFARRQSDESGCWAALESVEQDPLRLRALRSALASRPADRLGSVAALRMALGWSERHVPAVAVSRPLPVLLPPPPPPPPPPPGRRSRAGVVALTGLLVSLSAVFSVLWINGGSSSPADTPTTLQEAPVPDTPPQATSRKTSAQVSAPASAATAVSPAPAVVLRPAPPPPSAPRVGAAPKPATTPSPPLQTATAAGRKKPSDACIDWLRRRSLEPVETERARNPACE